MQWYGTRLAQGFGARKRDRTRDLLRPFDARGITPAAGYTSTVEDLAKFASWQFRLLRDGGQEVLRASTLREMQRGQWTDPDGTNTWGLGFGVGRDGTATVVGHSGSCPGYIAGLAMIPKTGLAVVVMINANTGENTEQIRQFTRPMRRLMQKGMAVEANASADLDDYAGRYDTQPWASEQIVEPWGKQLAVLELPSDDPAGNMELLRRVDGDLFRRVRGDDTLAEEWAFERDAGSRVVPIRSNGQVASRLAR